MKKIKYDLLQSYREDNTPIVMEKTIDWSEASEEMAKKEAYNGEYTIIDDDRSYPVAPHNITAGEYVTIAGTLYKAIENIPNGEPVIVGQNAVKTTVEEQLFELTKGV